MKLSVVTTLYYSEKYIEEFYERILVVVKGLTDDYEIIFINDASPDNSLEVVQKICQKDGKVKIIDLSRNFGHHKAIMAGLENAQGDFVFLIDVDLEEQPEWLKFFWEELNNNIDVVYGVQKKRKGNWFEKATGNLFYILFNFLSTVKISKNVVTARLMTKRYVESLLKYKEQELMLAAVMALVGYKQKGVFITKKNKKKTSYDFSQKMKLLVNAITSFSSKPLIIIFYIGVFMVLTSLLGSCFLVWRKMVYDISLGWTSIIVSIWGVGGIITFCVGILGIYLSKVFMEVKKRPYITIKDIITNEK